MKNLNKVWILAAYKKSGHMAYTWAYRHERDATRDFNVLNHKDSWVVKVGLNLGWVGIFDKRKPKL